MSKQIIDYRKRAPFKPRAPKYKEDFDMVSIFKNLQAQGHIRVLDTIFGFLDYKEMARLGQTCKFFSQFFEDEYWKQCMGLYLDEKELSKVNTPNLKHLFVTLNTQFIIDPSDKAIINKHVVQQDLANSCVDFVPITSLENIRSVSAISSKSKEKFTWNFYLSYQRKLNVVTFWTHLWTPHKLCRSFELSSYTYDDNYERAYFLND
mmetsp:Transcript_5189/g.4402  ORF Transcript_5189/g.4402 Transcript_5189/m.4402 type:complete len:206 (+) Transcript_5189:361-978(+)